MMNATSTSEVFNKKDIQDNIAGFHLDSNENKDFFLIRAHKHRFAIV